MLLLHDNAAAAHETSVSRCRTRNERRRRAGPAHCYGALPLPRRNSTTYSFMHCKQNAPVATQCWPKLLHDTAARPAPCGHACVFQLRLRSTNKRRSNERADAPGRQCANLQHLTAARRLRAFGRAHFWSAHFRIFRRQLRTATPHRGSAPTQHRICHAVDR